MRTRRSARRTAFLLAPLATFVMVLAGVALPSTAQAAGRDGVCNDGEFCYYYNSYQAGSVSDFTGSIGDYGATQPTCYEFRGPGNGQGVCVKNNAASVWNRSTKPVTVYYNSDYQGTSQTIAAGAKANLITALKNNNASHNFSLNNQQAAFNYFVGAGYTKVQSAGIVGNLMQESGSSIDPRAAQPGGAGRGIAQWSVGGRWDRDANDNAVWYAGTQGQSVWSLNLQLKFITYELNTFSGFGKAQLKAATTIDAAVTAFESKFERCGVCEHSTRVRYAQQVYNAYA
jgi:hypothetical protein